MITQIPHGDVQAPPTAYRESFPCRMRIIEPVVMRRDKDEFEAFAPLPSWTSWALVAWTIGSTAAYTAILARWWE